MRKLLTIALLTVLLAACSSTPDGVIPADRMAALLADMRMAEAVVDQDSRRWNSDSVKRTLLQSVYAAHGVTRQEVDSSMAWYGYYPEKYDRVLEQTTEILTQRLAQARQAGNLGATSGTTNSAEGDSVNMWLQAGFRRLTPGDGSNVLSFRYSRDRHWEKGDIYALQFKPYGTRRPIYVNMAAEYSDGSVDYIAETVNQSSPYRTTLKLDSLRTPMHIYGSITLDPADGNLPIYLDSIAVVRMHWKASRRAVTNPRQQRL